MSERARAVDELFEEFEEDSPEEVMALADGEGEEQRQTPEVFEDFATVPDRSATNDETEAATPAVDVDRLFGE